MVALAIYSAIAAVLFGKPLLEGGLACVCAAPSVVPGTHVVAGDVGIFVWALAWWPHAIWHGLNPFYTHLIYAPQGINLAHATMMPGAALLLAPVTAIAGPLFSFSLAMVLSPVLAAFFAFLLCRRLTHAFWPSLIGGWLFGFSTYMLGQLGVHLNLTFVFLVPALVHLTLRGLAGELSQRRFVALLVLALTLQFSFSLEVLASLTLFGAIAFCIAYAMLGELRSRLRALLGSLALSYLLTAVIVSPYLYYFLQPGGVPLVPGANKKFSNDLLAFVLPTKITSLGGHAFGSATNGFKAGYIEGGAYLGVPLILLLVLATYAGWRRREVKVMALTLIAVVVCSLGAYLHIEGAASIPLPWWLVHRLPIFGLMLPSRFILYGVLIAAMMTAIWLASGRYRPLTWILAVLSVAFLWPAATHRHWRDVAPVPKLFASSAHHRAIGPRDVTLVLPVGVAGQSMLWQAEAHFGFTMASGYLQPPTAPDPYKRFSIYPTLLYNVAVPREESAAAAFLASEHVSVVALDARNATNSPWIPILEGLGWNERTLDGAILLRPGTIRQAPTYVSHPSSGTRRS